MARLIGEKTRHSVPVWAIMFDKNGNRQNTFKHYVQDFVKYFDNNTAEHVVVTEKDIIQQCKEIYKDQTIHVVYSKPPARIDTLYKLMNSKW